jgi:hypothetical protein
MSGGQYLRAANERTTAKVKSTQGLQRNHKGVSTLGGYRATHNAATKSLHFYGTEFSFEGGRKCHLGSCKAQEGK